MGGLLLHPAHSLPRQYTVGDLHSLDDAMRVWVAPKEIQEWADPEEGDTGTIISRTCPSGRREMGNTSRWCSSGGVNHVSSEKPWATRLTLQQCWDETERIMRRADEKELEEEEEEGGPTRS